MVRPDTGPYLKMWRDQPIAAHAHTAPLLVVTNNLKDFAHLGDRAIPPSEAMQRFAQ